MAGAFFFLPFFSSLSFNTHGHNMTDPKTRVDRQLQFCFSYVEIHIIEILNIMNLSVATGTRARLFGTHISGGVLRAASAHGLPPLALVVCILMKQSRQDLKYESDSEYICRAPVPGITLEKKGNAAEKEKDKEMM
ncbi:hypothetical protein F8388_023397 [Cannabis sativa]|uniref:Uncharacterized protein n=1 Tax=Cannabis sativa TaxID=3483 RepID=A0A7J6HE17_CANSA|nr:hypothetical protein F8388_023397 [Cannabis sativa]